MIAFVDDLPLLEFENGRVFAFRREWLRQHLLQAASKAGYTDWWLADHVAQSVTNYLTSQYESNVLGASELRKSVSEVLATIGYAEIARHFVPTRPAPEISLLELAASCGNYEMAFFAALRNAIEREIDEDATSIRLIHLAPAVKQMLGVKLFTEECSSLRKEIVAFSRFIASQCGKGPFTLLLRS